MATEHNTAVAVTFDPSLGVDRRGTKRSVRPEPLPDKPPRPWVVDLAAGIAGIGLGATTGLAFTAETHSELVATGGIWMFAGNLTALVGTYLALVMVLLVSRIPAIEHAVGQDRLIRWHRMLAPWPLTLITLHVVMTTIGYAQAAKAGFMHQVGTFIKSYPDMLTAIIGFALMAAIGLVSIRAVRQRIPREAWWTIHLWMYMALALAFMHQIALGPSFVGHPLARAVWSLAWLASAGVVLAYRVGLPIWRSFRYRLRVVAVQQEAPGVVSVICSGRNLDRLRVSGGQFMLWRFLAHGIWWQAHPYSLSALPQPSYVRLTVKDAGDHSRAMADLAPGTRVMIEGPYGAFTKHSQRRRRAALIAGGIGVTALRSLLEDMPGGSGGARPVVIVRASRPEDIVFRDELAALVKHRRGALHEIIGRRSEVALDEATLSSLVPDITGRDVYVCGPEGFVHSVTGALRHLGVPRELVHHEAFSL
jgi:predicted ferric reductase